MKEMIVKVFDNAFTYAILGMMLFSSSVALLYFKAIDIEWSVVLIGYACSLLMVSVNLAINDAYSVDYASKINCKVALWFMILLFVASTVGLLIKVVEFTYAILHG